MLNNDKRHRFQVVIIAKTMQKYVPYGFVGNIETVFVQSDARVARRGFNQQCNSSGAVQKSHLHSRL